jgi:hypothetical protein
LALVTRNPSGAIYRDAIYRDAIYRNGDSRNAPMQFRDRRLGAKERPAAGWFPDVLGRFLPGFEAFPEAAAREVSLYGQTAKVMTCLLHSVSPHGPTSARICFPDDW